ncbi:MAG: hypothetical protein CO140_03020 [Candidatus Moranbacteria bacterium CG_4_9_14_3_um_filter_40_7]|nr:MAG: hypothetical protein COX31_03285 [Candidatus Moranbacteria bacterium CG23_combo_of_CG06-09_8_20_14_all_40_16]PIU81091.1 MAG: hypothetical protein COS71_00055 [Candidatus Moranbacteria bacterium CG06_land_8_20_14_3_00_40_12]PJA87682.1 MAG: hypothetical protein CO140_03020 [Candidatus Moranbacteria bacterium CG_4_9_14_3_um_filter_40_7]
MEAETSSDSLTIRYRTLLAAIPDIIMEVNNKKIYTWANRLASAKKQADYKIFPRSARTRSP